MARGKKTEKVLTLEEKLEQALVPVEEQPYPVPENWCWVYAPMLFDVEYGKGLSTKDLTASGYPVFGANGQIGYYHDYMFKTPQALMSCRGAYSGTMNKSLPFSYVTSNSLVIKCKIDSMTADYICYLFSALDTRKLVSGTAQPQVTVQAFSDYPVPVVPVAEQRRIVQCIESLFDKLDEAKEKAQAVVDGFETRKAAILHKAFTGELTTQWRKEHKVGIESWKCCKYAELGTAKLGKMLDKSKNTGQDTKYLRNINVRWFEFDLSDLASMLANDEERTTLSVEQGDLFICEGGEPGRCAVWKENGCDLIYQKALHRFRPNHRTVNDFLCYNLFYMNSNGSLEQYFTGSTIKHLTGQSLAKIELLLPSRKEQLEIVRILDNLFDKEQQAKEAAEAALDQIETMKKSILARAFRGELGTNDPAEESSVELLKRTLLI